MSAFESQFSIENRYDNSTILDARLVATRVCFSEKSSLLPSFQASNPILESVFLQAFRFLLVNSPLVTLLDSRRSPLSNADSRERDPFLPTFELHFSPSPLSFFLLYRRIAFDSLAERDKLEKKFASTLARAGKKENRRGWETLGSGYLRVAFCIARISAHTRISEAHREGTRNRTGVKAPLRSHGVLLWPCRVKGTRKLARPSCYVKPNFSLGIGRRRRCRRYPLLRTIRGGKRRGRRLGNASTSAFEPWRAARRGVHPRGGEPPPSLALINSRHGPLSRLCRPSPRSRAGPPHHPTCVRELNNANSRCAIRSRGGGSNCGGRESSVKFRLLTRMREEFPNCYVLARLSSNGGTRVGKIINR